VYTRRTVCIVYCRTHATVVACCRYVGQVDDSTGIEYLYRKLCINGILLPVLYCIPPAVCCTTGSMFPVLFIPRIRNIDNHTFFEPQFLFRRDGATTVQ
jgi:hypothetical protein